MQTIEGLPAKVLLVTGDAATRARVDGILTPKRRCQLEFETDVVRAVERSQQGNVCLALFHVDGVHAIVEAARFLYETNTNGRKLPTVLLNQQSDVDISLNFMRMGAVECLTLDNVSRISLLVDMILARDRIRPHTASGANGAGNRTDSGRLSQNMQRLMEEVELVAPLQTTVLVTGETGVGKTRLGWCIHNASRRAAKEFLTVNCGALSPTLIESELFGHVRGSFTGADSNHEGKFARADGGTLLLDDIDAMSLEIQAKLLRAVDERVYEPLGSNRTQPMNARLVVATNKCLEQEARSGRFRQDLFYRLNVIRIHLPPLRERREEIRYLAEGFLAKLGAEQGISPPGFSGSAMDALESYDWPGNIRELRNTVERAMILSRGEIIQVDVLPDQMQRGTQYTLPSRDMDPSDFNRLAEARCSAEEQRLREVLRETGNNRSNAARVLGISRTALYKKLRKYALV
jgi:DNA-binding NtrC family response regulator